jgi:hypothetical protein
MQNDEGGSAFTKLKRPRWLAKFYPVSKPSKMYGPGPKENPEVVELPHRRSRSGHPREFYYKR